MKGRENVGVQFNGEGHTARESEGAQMESLRE